LPELVRGVSNSLVDTEIYKEMQDLDYDDLDEDDEPNYEKMAEVNDMNLMNNAMIFENEEIDDPYDD
jgi:hypothetical protein